LMAAGQGFVGVDTALGYNNQAGVGEAVRQLGRDKLFVTTKVPPCKATDTVAECSESTSTAVNESIAELGIGIIDLMLLHGPVSNGADGPGMSCADDVCSLVQAQWKVMESMISSKTARAVGVSNYCQRCFECLNKTATIQPMLNQIQYHAGMNSSDPDHLISFCQARGIVVQAYSPLGNYATHSLLKSNVTAKIGKLHNKSAAQVGLRWVVQNGAALAVAAHNKTYLKEDVDLFSWSLSTDDMGKLSNGAFAFEGPTRGHCVG